jgi:predicted Holliday junction resolvase-like endonuclease
MGPATLLPIVVITLLALLVGYLLGRLSARLRYSREVLAARKDAVKRSRSALTGQVSEQLAPYLPGFPWNPNEVRFLGKPIDFLVFKGMDEKRIDEVVFVEVKAGESTLSPVERSLRDAIQEKRVSWAEWRVPEPRQA